MDDKRCSSVKAEKSNWRVAERSLGRTCPTNFSQRYFLEGYVRNEYWSCWAYPTVSCGWGTALTASFARHQSFQSLGWCESQVRTFRFLWVFILIAIFNFFLLFFSFATVYKQDANNFEIYKRSVEPMVELCFGGFTCSFFTFGESQSGKSYTLAGENIHKQGLVPLAIDGLFSRLEEEFQKGSCPPSLLER